MDKKALLIGNVHFPSGSTAEADDALLLVAKAAKRRAALRTKLKKAGKGAKVPQEAQKAYLGSSLARLDALIRAAKHLDYKKKLEVSQYELMAGELKLYAQIDEPVRVYLKEKSSGGHRYFCDFGIRHRAAQALVADIINAQLSPKPFQYNVKGRGVAVAIKQIRQLHADGYKNVVRLDIQRFFDSFDHKAIMQVLPIAKDVTEHVVIGKHFELQGQHLNKEEKHLQDTLDHYLSLIAERGLPQGSASSPAIANFVMSKIEPKLPKGARFLNYVDDFLILAQSPERAEKAKNALTSSIKEMPVGHFELLEKSSGSLLSGVEFLGHAIVEHPDGSLGVTISPSNVHKIMAWTAEELERITDKFAADEGKAWVAFDAFAAIVRFAHHVFSWLQTFKQAGDVGKHEEELLERIDTLALATGQDADKIKALARKMPAKDVEPYPA